MVQQWFTNGSTMVQQWFNNGSTTMVQQQWFNNNGQQQSTTIHTTIPKHFTLLDQTRTITRRSPWLSTTRCTQASTKSSLFTDSNRAAFSKFPLQLDLVVVAR